MDRTSGSCPRSDHYRCHPEASPRSERRWVGVDPSPYWCGFGEWRNDPSSDPPGTWASRGEMRYSLSSRPRACRIMSTGSTTLPDWTAQNCRRASGSGHDHRRPIRVSCRQRVIHPCALRRKRMPTGCLIPVNLLRSPVVATGPESFGGRLLCPPSVPSRDTGAGPAGRLRGKGSRSHGLHHHQRRHSDLL